MKPVTFNACVDIGGTKVAVGLAEVEAEAETETETDNTARATKAVAPRPMLARSSEPTATSGSSASLAAQVIRMLDSACTEQGITRASIAAVGVASCGPFVFNQGLVELANPNICGGLAGPARGLPNDWTSAALEAPLRAAFNNVRVENDCVAALEAERRWGALAGLANCAYVTWSTGIGVGLCVDGRVLRGKSGNAGHAGHMFVSDNAQALCGCGNRGDLESLVAGNSIARRFGQAGYAHAAALLNAAQQNDAQALLIVDELCRIMARGLYNLIITLDLERISLGGGVFWHHRELLLPRLSASLRGKLPALTDGCDLVPAGLGLDVGELAALALVA